MACKGCFDMYTREETLLAEEIRERQPVNFALENLGRKGWRKRTIHCKMSKDSKVRKSGACLQKEEKGVNQFY